MEHSWARAGGQGTVYLRSETLGFGNMTLCRLFRFLFPWTWRLYSPTCRIAWPRDTAPCPGKPEFLSPDAVTCTHPFLTHSLVHGCIRLTWHHLTTILATWNRIQSQTAISTFTLLCNVRNLDKYIDVLWGRCATVILVVLLLFQLSCSLT